MDRGCLGDRVGEGAPPDLYADLLGQVAGKYLGACGLAVQTEAKRLASQPGRGRTYRRGGVVHVASAPGDPPAPDTGRLRASIGSELARDAKGLHARVGSRYPVAVWLELGTRRTAPRPFLRPALPAARTVNPGRFGSASTPGGE